MSVLNTTLRFLLFVSSYFPAFLIIAILYRRRHPGVAIAALAIGLAGCAGLAAVLRYLRSLVPKSVQVVRCSRQDAEAMTYVVSYVVPFLFGVLEGPDSAVAFGVFFLVIGILYANSNMIHINPMLNVVGYRIYQVETGALPVTLISRYPILPGGRIDAVDAGGEIFLHVPSNGPKGQRPKGGTS